jgi:hypothetical protein
VDIWDSLPLLIHIPHNIVLRKPSRLDHLVDSSAVTAAAVTGRKLALFGISQPCPLTCNENMHALLLARGVTLGHFPVTHHAPLWCWTSALLLANECGRVTRFRCSGAQVLLCNVWDVC